MSFFELLDARAKSTLLCVGLDPRSKNANDAQNECCVLIDQTKEFAAAYKPNAAFFELLGCAGWDALRAVIEHVPPHIPVILDAKRGDIADTAQAYAKSAFERLKSHGITVAPYMGVDSLAPFLAYKDKGVFVLVKTSNKGSSELQTLPVGNGGGKALFEVVAEKAQTSWNYNGNVGVVVGATDAEAISRVRAAAPRLWILVPGVGAQGGDLRSAVLGGLRSDRSGILVNVSRAVSGSANPGAAAKSIRDEINAIRFPLPSVDELAAALVRSRCVRFGHFKLKSGNSSPIYLDLRQLVSFPDVLQLVARSYSHILRKFSFDRIVGLPYAALPIATAVSLEMGVPLIYPRRESAKDYGTKASIEGAYNPGDRVVIIDDLVSTGETKLEALEKMAAAKLQVVAIVVLIDREMGAQKYFADRGHVLEAVVGLKALLPLWLKSGAITHEQQETVLSFLSKL